MSILLGEQRYVSPGSLAANNDTTAAYVPGSVIVDAVGNKYVYVLAGYTTTAGDAVTVDFTDTANVGTNALATGNTYKVITPTTATLSNFFGIMLGAVTSAKYGWCQVAGFNQVALASTTATAGDFLKVQNASTAMVNDHAQGGVVGGASGQSYLWGAAIQTSVAGATPAIGTVFIYGMGAVLGK